MPCIRITLMITSEELDEKAVIDIITAIVMQINKDYAELQREARLARQGRIKYSVSQYVKNKRAIFVSILRDEEGLEYIDTPKVMQALEGNKERYAEFMEYEAEMLLDWYENGKISAAFNDPDKMREFTKEDWEKRGKRAGRSNNINARQVR